MGETVFSDILGEKVEEMAQESSLRSQIVQVFGRLSQQVEQIYKNWKRYAIASAVVGAALFAFYKFLKRYELRAATRVEKVFNSVEDKYKAFVLQSVLSDLTRRQSATREFLYAVFATGNVTPSNYQEKVTQTAAAYGLATSDPRYLAVSALGYTAALKLYKLGDEIKEPFIRSILSPTLSKKIRMVLKAAFWLFIGVVVFVLVFPILRKLVGSIENTRTEEQTSTSQQITMEHTILLETAVSSGKIKSVFSKLWDWISRKKKKENELVESICKMKWSAFVLTAVGIGALFILIRSYKRSSYRNVREFLSNFWSNVVQVGKDKGVVVLLSVGMLSSIFFLKSIYKR